MDHAGARSGVSIPTRTSIRVCCCVGGDARVRAVPVENISNRSFGVESRAVSGNRRDSHVARSKPASSRASALASGKNYTLKITLQIFIPDLEPGT